MFISTSQGRPQRGVTLIEAVLFIVIALALTVGGIVLFQQSSTSARVRDAVQSVIGLQSGVRALHLHEAEFAPGDLLPGVIASASFPLRLTGPTAGALVNEFGGSVEVTGFGRDAFTVSYGNVPAEACSRMIGFAATGDGVAGTGIFKIGLLGAGGSEERSWADGGIGPVTAAELCAAAGDGATVTYYFSSLIEDPFAAPPVTPSPPPPVPM